jgi:hypothetical protein
LALSWQWIATKPLLEISADDFIKPLVMMPKKVKLTSDFVFSGCSAATSPGVTCHFKPVRSTVWFAYLCDRTLAPVP